MGLAPEAVDGFVEMLRSGWGTSDFVQTASRVYDPEFVQYAAKNTGGTALFSCTVTDSNTVISSTAVPIGDVVMGGTSSPVPVNTTCRDELNAGERTDRFIVLWELADAAPVTDVDVPRGAELFALPEDIVALRRSDPTRAASLRMELRAALEGRRVHGVTDAGEYVLV